MTTTLQKWGNSQGIRLPKPLLNALGLKESAKIQLTLDSEHGAIVLTAVKSPRKTRGRHRIEDLAAAMPRNFKAKEFGWGVSGREVW
jgi:antitoxin MazE